MAVAPPPGVPNRPDPPESLTEAQAALWVAIVAEKPAGWFDAASQPLLASYVRAVTFSEELAREYASLGKKCLKDADKLRRVKVLKDMQEKQEKLMATLATKLRLTNQSRYTPQAADTAARNAAKPKLWEVSGG